MRAKYFIKKTLIAALLSVLLMGLLPGASLASWLIYHKPAFHGKVIDAETKEPIEGAVVVAAYEKSTIGIAERYSSVIHVHEALTDKNGEFHIPSYTTVIQPLSISSFVRFIIYKPGYGNYPNQHVSPPSPGVGPEEFFSEDLGKKGEVVWLSKQIEVTFGIVELPREHTEKERLNAIPSSPDDIRSNKLPELFKAINEERKRYGLGEVN